jgi:hypothetical protein
MSGPFKPNGLHRWAVEVRSLPKPAFGELAQEGVYGTIGDALRTADELDSEVDFEVQQFIITRAEEEK